MKNRFGGLWGGKKKANGSPFLGDIVDHSDILIREENRCTEEKELRTRESVYIKS